MAEITGNSIERLTDERMLIAMGDASDPCEVARTVGRCRKAFRIFVEEALTALEGDPDGATMAAALALAIVVGWKAREALIESEILERMAR